MFGSCHGFTVLIVLNVLLTYLDTSCGFHLLEPSSEVEFYSRSRRQLSTCVGYTFRCNSGNCISKDKQCDGVVDCPDGSDETLRCQETGCPEYSFRCAYGACVDGDAECNGKKECSDNSDETNCKNNTQSLCGDKFTCTNGQCIDRYLLCDGEPNCADGSDETYNSCNSIPCQAYSHRCSYGACVDGDAKCNGKKECADGSDEAPEICGTPVPPGPTESPVTPATPQSIGGSCTLPSQPQNGKYTLPFDKSIPLTAGQAVNDGTIIGFECIANYQLYPANSKLVICIEGKWNLPFPTCLSTCPARVSSSVETDCELDGIKVDCSKPMAEGTLVTMKCKHLFEPLEQSSRNPVSRCKDGTWDYGLIRCAPVCGKVVPKGTTLVVGGENAKMGDFPWHVGVYRKSRTNKIEHKCGGSLINTKLVLSAAHCFTSNANGAKFPIEEFHIAAGKYYRDFDDNRDTLAQKSKIKDIKISPDYRGVLSSFAGDIAVVVLETPVVITHAVQPVCIDWINDFEDRQLIPDKKGKVVGWGFTKEGREPSSELKQLEVPYIDRGQCFDVVPQDFYTYLTQDKFCAGFTTGQSVCNGDSGGGLVFLRPEDQRWYLRGLVSVGPIKEGACDSKQYGAYTKLSDYRDYVSRIEISSRD